MTRPALSMEVVQAAHLTVKATLAHSTDRPFQDHLNDVGSGQFSLLTSDDDVASITYGDWTNCKLDGTTVFTWRIENIDRIAVDEAEEASQIVKFSGQGIGSLMSQAVVYPAQGLGRRSADTRLFNFASATLWRSAYAGMDLPVEWNPGGPPYGWPDPSAAFIWNELVDEVGSVPPGDVYFYAEFTTPKAVRHRLFAAGDDAYDVWVDEVQVLSILQQGAAVNAMHSADIDLDAGTHVIAVKATNADNDPANPAGFICSIYKLNGAALDSVVLRTDDSGPWKVLAAYPDRPPGATPGQIMRLLMQEASIRLLPATLISNGDFETGDLTDWTIEASTPAPVVNSALAHSGMYSVVLGTESGSEPDGDSAISHVIDVPSFGGEVSFWYYPLSRDSVTYDWQEAEIRNLTGDTLAVIFHQCSDTRTWTHQTFDLSPWAGETVALYLNVHQDGASDDTSMRVDDVTAPPTTVAFDDNFGQFQYKFSDTEDANGDPWPSTIEFTVQVGADYLSVLRQLAETDCDFRFIFPGTISAPKPELALYIEAGTDLSGSVALEPAVNLTALEHNGSIAQMTTSALVRYQNGYIEVTDPGISAGRRESSLSLGTDPSLDQATATAAAALARKATPEIATTAATHPATGPFGFIDYGVADWITAPDETGTPARVRVRALTVSEDVDGVLSIVPELNTIKQENWARVQRQLRTMTSPSIGGTVDSAAPAIPIPTFSDSTLLPPTFSDLIDVSSDPYTTLGEVPTWDPSAAEGRGAFVPGAGALTVVSAFKFGLNADQDLSAVGGGEQWLVWNDLPTVGFDNSGALASPPGQDLVLAPGLWEVHASIVLDTFDAGGFVHVWLYGFVGATAYLMQYIRAAPVQQGTVSFLAPGSTTVDVSTLAFSLDRVAVQVQAYGTSMKVKKQDRTGSGLLATQIWGYSRA